MKCIQEFEEYTTKIGNRKSLYRVVSREFHIKSALYPGSHIDINPSLVIPDVIYIDNFRHAIRFFDNMKEIKRYIDQNKEYPESSKLEFFGVNYKDKIDIHKVDMIISQYAGFVGQDTKHYLKKGGILLCNDSHGDATLAYLDDDYEFIGVVDSGDRVISTELDKYFQFARKRDIDMQKVKKEMKGPKYQFQAANYIFRLK